MHLFCLKYDEVLSASFWVVKAWNSFLIVFLLFLKSSNYYKMMLNCGSRLVSCSGSSWVFAVRSAAEEAETVFLIGLICCTVWVS